MHCGPSLHITEANEIVAIPFHNLILLCLNTIPLRRIDDIEIKLYTVLISALIGATFILQVSADGRIPVTYDGGQQTHSDR
jgi:hypothetical protein